MSSDSKQAVADDSGTRVDPVFWISAIVGLTISYYLLRLDVGGLPVDVAGTVAGVLCLGWTVRLFSQWLGGKPRWASAYFPACGVLAGIAFILQMVATWSEAL